MLECVAEEIYDSPPDDVVCKSCTHLKATNISLWCTHKDAKEKYGNIPGRGECEFWKRQRTWAEIVAEYQERHPIMSIIEREPDRLDYIFER